MPGNHSFEVYRYSILGGFREMAVVDVVEQEKAAMWADEIRMVDDVVFATEISTLPIPLGWFELEPCQRELFQIARRRVKSGRLPPGMRGNLERVYDAIKN